MSAEAIYHTPVPPSWDDLLRAWHETVPPLGWRAEIIEENIVLSPAPGKRHNHITDLLEDEFRRVRPEGCGIYTNLAVAIPHRFKLFIPDLVVVPRSDVLEGADNAPVPAELALMVAEITSKSNANDDRTTKRWGYAHAGVPIYLLIDRYDEDGPSVSLLTRPVDGHYKELVRVEFGKKIAVPEPFGFELDTSEF